MSAALSLPTGPALLSGLIFQAQFRCSVSSHGPSSAVRSYVSGPVSLLRLSSWTQFVFLSPLIDPVGLPVSSQGPSSAVLSYLSCPVSLLRLMDPVPLPVSSHGSSSFARLFSWTQLLCPSLFMDPVPLPVSTHGPSSFARLFSWIQFVCPSLLMDPVPLPVCTHGPSSFARLYPRTQLFCPVLSFRPSFIAPSLLTDPVSLLRLFLRTHLRCPIVYFRPSFVAPSLFTYPVQCPVHLPVLFHPVPSDPVQFFLAIRTRHPLISGRSVVSTRMCACCSCDFPVSILFVKTYY